MGVKKKPDRLYLIVTLVVWGVFWWGLVFVSWAMNSTMSETPVLYIPYIIGGFSPAIGSCVALRVSDNVSVKSWLRMVFNVRVGYMPYCLMVFLLIAYFLIQSVLSGYEQTNPFVAGFILMPIMLFMGGIEETGWRMVLQPIWENRFGYVRMIIMVSAVWWLWHFPLFLMKGSSYNGKTDFIVFGISIIGMTLAQALIYRFGGVFPCIILHTMINSFSSVYSLNYTLVGAFSVTLFMALFSLVVFLIQRQKKKVQKSKMN